MKNTGMHNLTDLPVDVLLHILSQGPDFPSLAAAARTCRRLRTVCESHTAAILRNVLHIAAGSPGATAAALRGIRVEEELALLAPTHEAAALEIAMRSTSEADELSTVFKRRHFSALTARVAVAQRLEVHFSRASVDPNTRDRSMLSEQQSVAFQVAVQRVWLYCFLYSFRWTIALSKWSNPARRRALFFSAFSPLDKHNFMLVAGWMISVFERSRRGWIRSDAEATRSFMSLGPEGILDVLDAPSIETFVRSKPTAEKMPWITRDDDTSISRSFGRRMVPSASMLPVHPPEGTSFCSHCDTHTPGLYNQENWVYGPHHLQLPVIGNYLSGVLGRNPQEVRLLLDHLGLDDYVAANSTLATELRIKTTPSPLDHRFARFILALVNCDGGDTFSAAGLTPNSLLCADCLELLVRCRSWLWWRLEKESGRVDGYKAVPDCLYGYACGLQKNCQHHNETYNHAAPLRMTPPSRRSQQ